ncbi:MAG: hypothetical protein GY851_33875 [bacterium]|nr:hypothetical protein [bacterium]
MKQSRTVWKTRVADMAWKSAALGILALALTIGATLASAQQTPTSPVATPTATAPVAQTVRQTAPRTTTQAPTAPASSQPTSTASEAPARAGRPSPTVHSVSREVSRSRTLPTTSFEAHLNHAVTVSEVPDVGDPITLSAEDGPIMVTLLLDDLAVATGWNILASKGVETESLRFWFRDVRPKQALEVLRFNGIHYRYDEASNFLYVMLQEEYLNREFGAIKETEFKVEHADIIDMEAILTSLKSQSGRIIADPRTGHIFVWDTEDNIQAMKIAVGRLDEPLDPRVFEPKYLEAETLLESVQNLLSERGLAHVDPRTNALVVSDLPARQGQIEDMIQALDVQLETRTYTLDYAEVEAVEERLQVVLPEEIASITSDEDTHQISVTAIPSRLEEVDGLVAAWDVKRPQVMIEAFLVSAKTEVTRQLGVDWSYFDEISGVPFALQSGSASPDYNSAPSEGQRSSIGRLPYRQWMRDPLTGNRTMNLIDKNPATTGAVSNEAAPDPGAAAEYILDPEFKGNRVAIVLNYLDKTGALDILSRPRETVYDGQEAIFENTTEIPYQEGGYSQYTSTSNSNPNFNRVIPLQVQFVEVGTILTVTPRINREDNVLLELEAEDSTADIIPVLTGDQTTTVPQKSMSKVTTSVLTHSGETIVIGGLRFTKLDDDVERVPVLGDIPLVGRLFRTTNKIHEDREMLIFLTSTIVDEFTHPEASRLAEAEENATDTMRHSKKGIFGRTVDQVTRGENEIGVAIGHTGAMYCDGEFVTVESLQVKFMDAESPLKTTVIIQAHPRAPEDLARQIEDAARAAGLNVEYDASRFAVVPNEPAEQKD